MYSGGARDVAGAINRAKNTRGQRVGCSEAGYSHAPVNLTEPALDELKRAWRTVHAPRLAG